MYVFYVDLLFNIFVIQDFKFLFYADEILHTLLPALF